MRCVLTPEQRTQILEVIAAELARAGSTAIAGGADPAEVRRALATRIIALTAGVDRAR